MSQVCCHRIRQPAATLGGPMKSTTRIHKHQFNQRKRRRQQQQLRNQDSDGSNKLRPHGAGKSSRRRRRRSSGGSSTRDSTRSKRFSLARAAEPPKAPTPEFDINNNDNDNSDSKKCQNNHHSQPGPPAHHDRLPSDLLDRLAGEILEHTKELGLFDEMRMKLLEGIECSKEFRRIKQDFKDELESFCSRADLGLPRSKLREKLNAKTLHRSARQLRDHVGQVSREHWNELRKLYHHQANQFLRGHPELVARPSLHRRLRRHSAPGLPPKRLEVAAVSGLPLLDSNNVNYNNNNDGNRTVIEYT